MSPTAPGVPRWRTRLALTAVVLLAHLWLLVDGWPGGAIEAGVPVPGGAPSEPPRTTPAPAPAPAPDEPMAAVVTTSSIRWIPAPRTSADRAPVDNAPRRAPTAAPSTPRPAPATTRPAVQPAPADTPAPETPAAVAPAAAALPPQIPPPQEQHAAEPPPSAEPPSVTQVAGPSTDAMAAAAAGLTRVGPGEAQAPGSTLLRYDVQVQSKGVTLGADAELRWEVRGDEYLAKLEISALLVGSRVQTSQGKIGPQGLVPSRFGDRRRRSENAAHFDQAGGLVRFSNNAPDATLMPGGQDRLSVFLQIGSMMRARPQAFGPGQALTLQVTGTGGADIWSFEVDEPAQLNLPAGTMTAVRLTRLPRRDHDQKVELWLAPSLQFLPVRIRITDQDGGVADQRLRELPVLNP